MQIKFPEGLECRWCCDTRLNLVDVYMAFEASEHVLVIYHCTGCNRCYESISAVIGDVITPRADRKFWRSTHNPPGHWPYGTAVVGCYRVHWDERPS